jgi:hypothetical protein
LLAALPALATAGLQKHPHAKKGSTAARACADDASQ